MKTNDKPVCDRAAFHAWVRGRGGSVVQRNGEYIESMTRLWWDCWQAARPQSAAPQAPEGWSEALLDCINRLGMVVGADSYDRKHIDRVAESLIALATPPAPEQPKAEQPKRAGDVEALIARLEAVDTNDTDCLAAAEMLRRLAAQPAQGNGNG